MKQERLWYRDDITGPQRKALRRLRDTATGCAYAGNLAGVRLSTLNALHRHGLVKADDTWIQRGTVVTITQSGRESIADDEATDAN
jgi:hypothetical protein